MWYDANMCPELRKVISNLIKHKAHVSLLPQAATQAAQNLQTERFIGGRVVTRMNVHLDLFRESDIELTSDRRC